MVEFEIKLSKEETKKLLEEINLEVRRQSLMEQRNISSDMFTLVVAKLQKNIKVTMRTNENNHSLPHVHVETTDYSGSYTIDPIKRLAGNLPSWIESIFIKWALKNKSYLLSQWSDLRPSN